MATKTNVKPLFDYVLVKPLAAQDRTASGIYLPETAKEKPQEGEIVAIGPGAQDQNGKTIPMMVKVGQKVLYKKWGGDEYKVGREEWKLVRQTDILAIVE